MTGVVRLDRRVVHHEKNKMYDSMVVASRSHKVYDCLVGVSWSVEPGLYHGICIVWKPGMFLFFMFPWGDKRHNGLLLFGCYQFLKLYFKCQSGKRMMHQA